MHDPLDCRGQHATCDGVPRAIGPGGIRRDEGDIRAAVFLLERFEAGPACERNVFEQTLVHSRIDGVHRNDAVYQLLDASIRTVRVIPAIGDLQGREHGVEMPLPDRLGKCQLAREVLVERADAVFLDTVGGEQLQAAASCARHGARFLLLGALSAKLAAGQSSAVAPVQLDSLPWSIFKGIENAPQALHEACLGRLKGLVLVDLDEHG